MEIRIPEEISLRKIAESGQCFRWRRTGENAYKIPFGNRMLKIEQPEPELLRMNCTEEEYASVWKGYLDLDTDYGKMNAKIRKRKDPFLWNAMNAQRGVRILRQDPITHDPVIIKGIGILMHGITAVAFDCDDLYRILFFVFDCLDQADMICCSVPVPVKEDQIAFRRYILPGRCIHPLLSQQFDPPRAVCLIRYRLSRNSCVVQAV